MNSRQRVWHLQTYPKYFRTTDVEEADCFLLISISFSDLQSCTVLQLSHHVWAHGFLSVKDRNWCKDVLYWLINIKRHTVTTHYTILIWVVSDTINNTCVTHLSTFSASPERRSDFHLTLMPKVSLYSVMRILCMCVYSFFFQQIHRSCQDGCANMLVCASDAGAPRQVRTQLGQISQVNAEFSKKKHWNQRD